LDRLSYSDRLAQPNDFDFVTALHATPHARASLPDTPSSERYLAAIADPAREERVILDADGTPVGYCVIVVHDGWLAELRRIVALVPRRGIGRYAVRRLLSRAFDELGLRRAYLEVTINNAPARALYQREGFVLEGTFRDGYRGMDGAFTDLCAYGMLSRDR
jgi:RimJ/RimL family protein N-acetyltransferase